MAINHFVFSATIRDRSECNHFDAEVLQTYFSAGAVVYIVTHKSKWNVMVMLIKKDKERKRALQRAFKNNRPIISTYVIHEWIRNQLNLQKNKTGRE